MITSPLIFTRSEKMFTYQSQTEGARGSSNGQEIDAGLDEQVRHRSRAEDLAETKHYAHDCPRSLAACTLLVRPR